MARMRTNIELEMDYVEEIMRRFHLRTKTEAVDLALRQLAEEPMSREEALAMEGYFKDRPFDVPAEPPPRRFDIEFDVDDPR